MTSRNKREYTWFRLCRAVILFMPRRLCLKLGGAVAFLFYLLDKRHRTVALNNLDLAYGSGMTARVKKRIARRSFMHFGRTFFDLVKLGRLPRAKLKKLVELEGEEHVLSALREGKGAILFSAHLGTWEIAPVRLSEFAPMSVIARELDNPYLEKELSRIRNLFGASVIYKHQAAKQVLRTLRANEMVAILMDQNVLREQAEFVSFFGEPAATTPSTATFHLRTNAALLPVFCYPASKGRFRIVIHPRIDGKKTGENAPDIRAITQTCTRIIEETIKANPEVWLWFHNRWKTRPL